MNSLSVRIPRMMPHPAVTLLLWIFLAITMQSLATLGLLGVGLPLLLLAITSSAQHLATLLSRTRWIMCSLLVIYAYATPGIALLPWLGQFSPTQQGLSDGVLQLSRLVFALASLSILLRLLPQPQLISGLYALGYPLRYVGVSRERMAVRLALTLHYATLMPPNTVANWRSNIESGLAPVVGEQRNIELHVAPFVMKDGLLLFFWGLCFIGVMTGA